MAIGQPHSPAATAVSASTSRLLTPSGTATPPHLRTHIDSVFTHFQTTAQRLAAESQYDPEIPFHPGCKDCVRDYVRHIRGAERVGGAKWLAERREEMESVQRRQDEELERVERMALKKGRGKASAGIKEEGNGAKVTNSSIGQPKETSAAPASLAIAAKAMWGGGGGGGKEGGTHQSKGQKDVGEQERGAPAVKARASAGASRGQGAPSMADTNTPGQYDAEALERALEALGDLSVEQQMAVALNLLGSAEESALQERQRRSTRTADSRAPSSTSILHAAAATTKRRHLSAPKDLSAALSSSAPCRTTASSYLPASTEDPAPRPRPQPLSSGPLTMSLPSLAHDLETSPHILSRQTGDNGKGEGRRSSRSRSGDNVQ